LPLEKKNVDPSTLESFKCFMSQETRNLMFYQLTSDIFQIEERLDILSTQTSGGKGGNRRHERFIFPPR
jgi:hypothetical protein